MDDRLKILEKDVYDLKKENKTMTAKMAELEGNQREINVYIKQIFNNLEDLKITVRSGLTKEDLFKFLREQSQVQDRQAERDTNSANLAAWQKWTLAIIAGTLFVVLGYFFGQK
jgi:hypothetical protein